MIASLTSKFAMFSRKSAASWPACASYASSLPQPARIDVLRIDGRNVDGIVEVEAVDMSSFRTHQHTILRSLDDGAGHRMGKREPVSPGAPEPPVQPVLIR